MSVESSRKTNKFCFYAYYGLPGEGRPVRSKEAERQLLEAVARFASAHLENSRAKYKIEGMFSSGGFTVYGMRKASLLKLPEKFEDFTRFDIRELSHYEYGQTKPAKPSGKEDKAVRSSHFPYFMYYASPDDGTAALNTDSPSTKSPSTKSTGRTSTNTGSARAGSAVGRRNSTTPAKELSEVIAAFEAAHITGRKAKLVIESVPSMGGFTVYGVRKSTLEKLPKEFKGYTAGGVSNHVLRKTC